MFKIEMALLELTAAAAVVQGMASPNADEFELSDHGVTHAPTGHRLVFVPDGTGKLFFEAGHEPRVPEFDQTAVKQMAQRLWARHKQSKPENLADT
jgi:hypothetical protein